MKFLSSAIAFLACSSSSVSSSSSSYLSVTSTDRLLTGHNNNKDSSTTNPDCQTYEIDFIMIEGDAVRTAVEDEIVHMLAHVGIIVNTRKLTKEEFNAAEQSGDFHLSFSETWGAPYDPHAYAKGWVVGDEGHRQAMSGLAAPDTRESLFAKIETVLKEENNTKRGVRWEEILQVVHRNAIMLPLWGARIPTVLNNKRLGNYQAGNQQFDYPVGLLEVLKGNNNNNNNNTVTIAPGGQTGLFQSVGRLDPHTYRPNEFFSNNWIYEGLVSYGPYGRILPALAESWTVADHAAGQRYAFTLRPNVKFHDGAPWNCAAAKLNFDHVLAGALRTPDWHGWYGLMDQISNWECTTTNNDLEFIVDTKDKYYPFLQELSFIRPLRMLSPTAFVGDADPLTSNSCHVGWGNITSTSTSTATEDEVVVVNCAGITSMAGTGPFKFDSRTSLTLDDDTVVDSEVVFQRNTDYWDDVPNIETLVIKRYESSDQVKEALLDGSLDLVWGGGVLPASDLISLSVDETNNLDVFYSNDIQNVVMLLNSGKAPLDDIQVRKTIMHAVDKKTIIDNELGGIFEPVEYVFPITAPYCEVDLTPRWDYDLEMAELLNCPKASPAPVVNRASWSFILLAGVWMMNHP